MTKEQLQDLREQAALSAVVAKDKIMEAAEIAKLKATIALNTNDNLLAAKARLLMSEQDSNKLETLIKECSEIISSTPVHNKKTRENRKWSGQHRYGYGAQVDAVYQLATGIMYSCQEHKELLLMHTGLSMELLNQIVESFGNPAYYSNNTHAIVDEVPVSLDSLKTALDIIQSELGVVINTSKLTANNVELESVKAEINANKQLESAVEAISNADFAI